MREDSNPTRHETVQMLLPWYVGGSLDDTDRAEVEAHLAECGECRMDLASERAMRQSVARTPLDLELGWADMQRRLAAQREPAPSGGIVHTLRSTWVGWALAAQILLLVGAVILFSPLARPAAYHALSAVAAPRSGNALVMFRPDTTTEALRRILAESDARIVDGPTTTGAWVIATAEGEPATAIARLRIRHEVVLAEPIAP